MNFNKDNKEQAILYKKEEIKAQNYLEKRYKQFCKKTNTPFNFENFIKVFQNSYLKFLETDIYDGAIEYYLLNLRTKKDFNKVINKSKSHPFKNKFSFEEINKKKENQKRIGGKCSKKGIELEKVGVDFLNIQSHEASLIVNALNKNKNYIFEKAVFNTKTKAKTDFYLIYRHKDIKDEKILINVSQKSIQENGKSKSPSLHASSSQELIALLNKNKKFDKYSIEEKINLEILITLFFNGFFFDKDKIEFFNELVFSDKRTFNFWNKKEIFEDQVKNKGNGTGISLWNLEKYFKEQYNLLIDFINKNRHFLSDYFLFRDEKVDYLTIIVEKNKLLSFYSFEDILQVNQKSTIKINDKSIDLNEFVTLKPKGSGNTDDLIKTIKNKSGLQAIIKLDKIQKNIKPTISLTI